MLVFVEFTKNPPASWEASLKIYVKLYNPIAIICNLLKVCGKNPDFRSNPTTLTLLGKNVGSVLSRKAILLEFFTKREAHSFFEPIFVYRTVMFWPVGDVPH